MLDQAREAGVSGFLDADKGRYAWLAQPGAELYEVAIANNAQFDDCESVLTSETFWIDSEIPPPGGVRFYLVRAASPFAGSWGVGADDVERSIDCP